MGNNYKIFEGLKSTYYKNVVEELKKTSFYQKYNTSLANNWEVLLESNLFNIGNWYVKDKKMIFIIDTTMFELDEAENEFLNIEVDLLK